MFNYVNLNSDEVYKELKENKEFRITSEWEIIIKNETILNQQIADYEEIPFIVLYNPIWDYVALNIPVWKYTEGDFAFIYTIEKVLLFYEMGF